MLPLFKVLPCQRLSAPHIINAHGATVSLRAAENYQYPSDEPGVRAVAQWRHGGCTL
jgi:hypothetical protein